MATAEVPNENTVDMVDLNFERIITGVRADFRREEKPRRHAAYRQLGAVIARLLPSEQPSQALYAIPLELNGNPADRTLFLCRGNMPDHGTLLRAIVNDEARDPISGDRSLETRDFVVSTLQKSMTFQRSLLSRTNTDNSWGIEDQDGPVLFRRHDRLDVCSGAAYEIQIPKTRGYPHTPAELMANRLLIESLVEDLSQLDAANAEVGYASQLGIMS